MTRLYIDQDSGLAQKPHAVRVIIALNILVFIGWLFTNPFATEPGFMEQNFLVSWQALSEGRVWTLLTSVFSHSMFFHIFVNMFVLYGFGTVLEMLLGSRSFTRFYLVAGVISSLCHCLVANYFLHQPELAALGASGAVSGVILVFSLLFPREKILIMGLIPVPAIFGALIFIGLDVWGLIAQTQGGGLPIGHGAHLGGAFTGVWYYYFFLRPELARRRKN